MYAKADLRCWMESVFWRGHNLGGKNEEMGDFLARIQHESRLEFFNRESPKKARAAAIARDMYSRLRINGWMQTLTKYKARPVLVLNADPTGGEFLAELGTKPDLKPKIVESYIVDFRQLMSGNARTKEDYV
jgi:hypothetical protein